MMYVLYGILLLSVAVSKCTSLEGDCYNQKAKFTAQFNVNWKGVPTYVDQLSNVYGNGNNCAVRTYTMLFHNRLSCETSDKKTFNCNSTTESAWVRVWDTSFYRDIIENCGMKWHEQYQDVMKVPCVIGKDDQMYYVKQEVGKTSKLTVTIKNRKPVEYGGKASVFGMVITIFSIAIGVVLILVIALYIYANKHRAEKRMNQLNRSLVEGDAKTPAV
ncbi:hypothetical protein BLSTO_00094 [Blastocystis sp. subtype 1]